MIRRPFVRRTAFVVFAALSLAPAARPDDTTTKTTTTQDLARQIEELRAQYESRIALLEARIEALEAVAEEPEAEPAKAGGEDELAALLAAADAAAGETAPPPTPSASAAGPEPGKERNLNKYNPEISFTGDVLGLAGDGTGDFDPREFELDLQSVLDPFSVTKLTLSFSEEEGVDVEEGYIGYNGLASGLTVRAGKMRQSFGVLNRWHLHALPQPDYPLVVQTYLGEEGLAQTGVSAEWLLPHPWASANELVVQLTDGSADPFGGGSFDELVALAHLKNYWDVSDSTYLELGFSGARGTPQGLEPTELLGADLTLHWQPPSRAKYREITWRTEAIRSRRDDGSGTRPEAWGGYTYLEGLARRNLYVGARYDWFEDPLVPELETWAVEPYVSWWQSEFVRLRAAYRLLHDPIRDDEDGRFLFQITWAAGPHKHEAY